MTNSNRPTLPSHITALVFDIDRTISTRRKEFTDRTRQTITKLAQNKKFTLALCTGRAPVQAREIITAFPQDSIHVFNGGGVIWQDGQILAEELLPSDLVREISLASEELGAEFEFEHDGLVAVSPRKLTNSLPGKYSDANQLDDWSTSLLCIQWINEDVRRLVQGYDGIEVKEMLSEVNGPYFDITVQGVNKGSGIKRWSELTGIPLDQVAGFGDSENDLEFLSLVGWPVAMGNSPSAVKKVAKEVIGDCDEDGVAEYLSSIMIK